MALTGGISFYDNNEALLSDGASAVASNGDSTTDNALDRNLLTYWRTVGSSDSETVTFDLSLPAATSFSRIFLIDHNFRSFTVRYDVSGTPTDFTNVSGIDGALGGGISESTFSQNTAYYEFDSVTASTINVSVTTAQVTDADKFLNQIVVCNELGTLVGYPTVNPSFNKNERKRQMLSGKSLVIKSLESMDLRLRFRNYSPQSTPTNYAGDLDLMQTLFDRDEQFLVWLCGGKYGAGNFKYTNRGFRLRDLKTMQTVGTFNPSYASNVYTNMVNLDVRMEEVVD